MANKSLNVFDRLAIHQLTSIDKIRETIPKPAECLPPKYLATWNTMPVEQKIPLLPAPPGAMYYRRGDLGNSLLRKGQGEYILWDIQNRERVPSNKYEDLHDPLSGIEENSEFTKRLTDLGLVNEDGEVVCTIQEFNRYRLYLGALYNDEVRKKIALMDDYEKFEREQARALNRQTHEEVDNFYRQEKLEKISQFQMQKRLKLQLRSAEKQFIAHQNLLRLYEERRKQQASKVKANEEIRSMQKHRQKEKNDLERQWRKDILHKLTLRTMTATVLREHVQKNSKINREKRKADWFDAKLISSAQRQEREHELQETYRDYIRNKGASRQKRIEKYREELPVRVANMRNEKQRIEGLVRKYAMRWIRRVRARLNQPRDEAHESFWCPPQGHALHDCVENLYTQSGHAKLDDLVMNVLQFKEKIKKQIALEESLEEGDEDNE